MEYKIKLYILFLICGFVKTAVIKPEINDNELDFPELNYINKSVNPCDNFYEFACGNFEKYNPRPDNEPLWDTFKILQKKINNIIIDILASPIRRYDSNAVKKTKDMYYACINPDKNSEQSLKPLNKMIEDVGGWPLMDQILNKSFKSTQFSWDFIGQITAQFGLSLFINIDINPYIFDTSINMLKIHKDPLSLPQTAITPIEVLQTDEDIFFKNENRLTFKNPQEKPTYLQYLIDLTLKFVRSDWISLYETDIIEGNEEVFNFLIKIRDANQYPFGDNYTNAEVNNIADLQNWSDQFSSNFKTRINWMSFLNNVLSNTDAKITNETIIYISDPKVLANILYFVETTSPDVLMNFVIARLLTYMSPDANLELWEDFNELYEKLNYTTFSREEYCMRKITNYPDMGLSLAIAHEYQNYHFDVGKIYDPEEIIDELMASFFELLEENEWMDDEARAWVHEKANAMLRLIAFPDFIYDTNQLDNYYKKLQVCLHDHFGNSQRMRAFIFAQKLDPINKLNDRNEWSQSPLYVNAFYNALNNRITFPAGIMNEPFFTGKSRLVDYARIGALVGHEITHGFDTKGRNTDGTGNLNTKPWNKNVTDAFNERSSCFINQYSNYYIDEIDVYVNGSYTNPENIADNGGLREAFRTFQKLKKKSQVFNKSKEYTLDQLFFISYATMWCKLDTTYSLQTMHEKDNHAPNRFRVIGTLSNMQEFADTFNCPVGSNMNPENKCVLW